MSKSDDSFHERMKRDRDSNTTIQNANRMSQDEKRIKAVDIMTGHLKRDAEKSGNYSVTESQARQKAQEIAERAFKKVDG